MLLMHVFSNLNPFSDKFCYHPVIILRVSVIEGVGKQIL